MWTIVPFSALLLLNTIRISTAQFQQGPSCDVKDPFACDVDKLEVCTFVNAQYRCLCPPGIARDDRTGKCTVRNECADSRLNDCHQDSDCFDSLEGYRCICKNGFTDVSRQRDGSACRRKVDECANPQYYAVDCHRNAVCMDTDEGYRCDCLAGYIDVSTNYNQLPGRRCVQESNECQVANDCSYYATCADAPEGYSCRCNAGYIDTSPNPSIYPGRVCTLPSSVDTGTSQSTRCSGTGSSCGRQEECVYDSTLNGYTCQCIQNAVRSPDNTCQLFQSCSGSTNCDPNAICTNLFGSYTCTCPPGFMDASPDPNFPGRRCVQNVNECARPEDNNCSPYADCFDDNQGYYCVCRSGYNDVSSISGLQPGRRCTTTSNECSHRSLHTCDDHAQCVDLPDKYACQCETGFIDVSSSANLPLGRVCTVYTSCPKQKTDLMFVVDSSGSIGSSTFRNEVLRFVREIVELFDVGRDRTRVGLIQYSNIVKKEFYMNQFIDKDAVLRRINEIQYLSGLTRTGKAMEIMVRRGFQPGNGVRPRASDIARIAIVITDGQSQEQHEIDPAAQAALGEDITIFAVGVTSHVDKDELVRITGGYRERAFHVNDFTDLNVRLRSLIQKLACVEPIPVPTPGGQQCNPQNHEGCNRALNEVCQYNGAQYECTCPTGWQRHAITQCCGGDLCNQLLPSTCPVNTQCIQTPYRNYRCQCHTGYTRHPISGQCSTESLKSCNPNDPYSCGVNEQCASNSAGSYYCVCIAGFEYNSRLQKCVGIGSCDPSDGNACQYGEVCIQDNQGVYRCQCDAFYDRHPVTQQCVRNECASPSTNDCDPSATCTDTLQGYICQCPPNYIDASPSLPNQPGRKCILRIDECRNGGHNCSQFADCIDQDIGFTCQCRQGYVDVTPTRQITPGRDCRQIVNECLTGGHDCSPNADCSDTLEAFTCECRAGYRDLDPIGRRGRNCQAIITTPPPHPCDTGAYTCSPNADCLKLTTTQYRCQCRAGFDDESGGQGKVCNVRPITPPPGAQFCPDQSNLCYLARYEVCQGNQCVCQSGYQRVPSGECRVLQTIPMELLVVRRNNQNLQFVPDYSNPNTAVASEFTQLFQGGILQSLDQTQLRGAYVDSNVQRIYNPTAIWNGYDNGVVVDFITQVVEGSANQDSFRNDLLTYIINNNNQIGNSGLYIDPAYNGAPPTDRCGLTKCRVELNEVCDRSVNRCTCDPTKRIGPRGQIIAYGRSNVNQKCIPVEGWTDIINVVKYYANELNYNNTYANPNDPLYQFYVREYLLGLGQMYANTPYNKPYVYTEVNQFKNPFSVSASWDRGVVYNYTSYFAQGAVQDPRNLHENLINAIVSNNYRIGTTGLEIDRNQISIYSSCFNHTCDPRAICTADLQGSGYSCACPAGYKDADADRKGGKCVAVIDYCDDFEGVCGFNSTCVNLEDGGECQCFEGYVSIKRDDRDNSKERLALKLAGVECLFQRDIDYCALNLHDCNVWANCNNTIGGFECSCQQGYRDISPDNPGRFCAGAQCGKCNGNGDCTLVTENDVQKTICECRENWRGETCDVAVAAVGSGFAGWLIALLLAILFLLLALCCLCFFCSKLRCFGGKAAAGAASYTSGEYGYGQMTIPRARLARSAYGEGDRASEYSMESEGSSNYTVVERRTITEEKRVTNVPAAQQQQQAYALAMVPAGSQIDGIQLAQLTSGASAAGGNAQIITTSGSSNAAGAITEGSAGGTTTTRTIITNSANTHAAGTHQTQDRELEEYTEDDSASERSIPSTTQGIRSSMLYTDDPAGHSGVYDRKTTVKNTHDYLPGERERFATVTATKTTSQRY